MNTTTPHLTNGPPQSASPRSIAPRQRGSDSADRPSWGEVFAQTASLVGVPAFYGPPIIFLLGPWLLLVLLLIGPFALIVTILIAFAVAAGLLVGLVAVIASPYLLIRRLRAHGVPHPKPRAPLHLFRKARASSGQLVSPQPKAVS